MGVFLQEVRDLIVGTAKPLGNAFGAVGVELNTRE
jgi:hypothetical protein